MSRTTGTPATMKYGQTILGTCDNKKGCFACAREYKFGAVLTAMFRYGAESVHV